MGCTTGALKICIGLLGLFLWLCAIALIVIGVIILGTYDHIQELGQSAEIVVPSSIIIGAGAFLFIIGVIGCVGGFKGNKTCLSIFFIFMLVIIVSEVVALFLAFEFKDKIEGKLTNTTLRMIHRCSNTSADGSQAACDELDWIQSHFKCCGAHNYEDWIKSSTNATIPSSCCDTKNCTLPLPPSNSTGPVFDKGCAPKVVDLMDEYFQWVYIGSIIVCILQVLGLVATCIMLCRSKETPYLHLDSQGYRV